jgi:hypothetical protein
MTVSRLVRRNRITARRAISLGDRSDRSDSGVDGVDAATGIRGAGDPTRPEHSGRSGATLICVSIRLDL